MANKRITQLPVNTAPINSDVLPIVAGGATDQVTAQDLITKAHGLGANAVPILDSAGVMTPAPVSSAGYVLTSNGTVASFQPPSGGGQITYDAIVALSGGDYTTLSAAVAAASPGWNIFIRPGTYSESDININLNDLNIVGSGVGNTVLNFGSNQFFNSSGDNLNLSNLSMDYNGGYFYVAGQTPLVTNVEVTDIAPPFVGTHMEFPCNKGIFNNLVYNNNTVGSYSTIRVAVVGNDNKFNDCTFNVSLDGLVFSFARAIDTTNTDNTQFYNCVFSASNGPGTASVLFHNNTDALIVNGCTFNNASSTDDYAIYDNNASGSKITNSVFAGFGNAIYVQLGSGDTLVDSNQITSGTTAGVGIDVDYGSGAVVSNNKVTAAGGSSIGIRLFNAGEDHNITGNVIDNVGTGIDLDAGIVNPTLSSNTFRNIVTSEINGGNSSVEIVNGPALYDAVIDIEGFGQYTSFQDAWADTLTNKTIFVKQGLYIDGGLTTTNSDTNVTFVGDGKTTTNYVIVAGSFTGSGSYTFNNMTIVLAEFAGLFGTATFTGDVKFVNCNLVIDSGNLSYFNFNSPTTITRFENCFLITKDSDGTNSQFQFDSTTSINASTILLGLDFTSDIDNVCSFSGGFNSLQNTAVIFLSPVFTNLVDAPIKFTGNGNQILGNGFVTQFVTAGATGAMLNIQGSNNIINSNTFTNLGLLEATGVHISGVSAARNKIVGNQFVDLYRAIHSESEGYQQLISDNSCISAAVTDGLFALFDSGVNPNYFSVIANNIVEGTTSALTTLIWIENGINFVVQGNSLLGVDDGIYLGAASDTNRIYGNFIDAGVNPIVDNGVANVIGVTGSFTVGTNTIDVSEGIVTSII